VSLQPFQPQQPAPMQNLDFPAKVDLMDWAIEAEQVHKIAQALCQTSFVPPALNNRPDEVAAQILYGRDVGLPPMVALAQINIIERRPSMSALSMRGLAQSRGVKFRLDESTETRCKYSAMGPGDRDWTTVVWTMDRAKKLGLTSKKNWQSQPQAMLVARATSELCRLVAAPLFLGLAYSTEELQDGDSALPEQVPYEQPAAEPGTRTIKRAPVKATASVGEPAPQQPAPQRQNRPAGGKAERERIVVPNTPVTDREANKHYSEEDVPQRPIGGVVERPEMVGDNIRKALMASFNDAGIKDRNTRLAYVSDLLKREVDSVNQITDAEGKQILDQLKIDYPQVGGWDDVDVAEVPPT
jgi:hypothetical protein